MSKQAANEPAQDWFIKRIGIGLARLAALQLPGTPIDEKTAAAMRAVWVDTLWRLKSWDEPRDAERIGAAFDHLCVTCERFPAPASFLRHLPERTPQKRLAGPSLTEAQRRANAERVRTMIKKAMINDTGGSHA